MTPHETTIYFLDQDGSLLEWNYIENIWKT